MHLQVPIPGGFKVRTILPNLLLSAAGVMVGLILIEVILKFVAPYGTFGAGSELLSMRTSPEDLSKLYTIDPDFGFRPILGSDRYNEYGTIKNTYRLEKPPGVIRLLFIGDSVRSCDFDFSQ
jgi:hypothetical protein